MFNNTIHTYRSFSMGSDYSLGNLRMKTKDEPKAHISRYELREFLSYHKREISYNDFIKLKKQMQGICFSDIIDVIEELQEKLGADRFNVDKMMGHRFIHVWFRRSDTGYGSKYKFARSSWYKYMFSFNGKGELYQIDYDIK